MDDYSLPVLAELEAAAIHILREVAAESRRPAMLHSADRNSSVLLRLAQMAFAPGVVPFPLLRVGTSGDHDAVIDGERDPRNQRPEFWDLCNLRLKPGETLRVFPIAGWTENDISRYIQREKIEVAVAAAATGSRAEPGLLRFAVAGSVQSGKSTLVGRLLHDVGEQGVTIDAAWRHFSTPKRRFIVIDAPGHEQYTRNMGSGASHADLAVLLVDASLGVLTQTRRHAFICSLFGIPRLVVAVNKMDLAGWSQARFDELRAEFEQFSARLGFRSLAFVPVSALQGDNIVSRSERMPWYDGPPLLALLESVYTGGDRNLVDFRLAVQWVARSPGGGRRYCGQVCSGVVKAGDEVIVLPSHRRSRVRSIRLRERELQYAFAPMSVAIELEEDLDAGRGAMLAHPANVPHAARSLEAMLVWLHERSLRPGADYLLKHGASWVRASCAGLAYRINHDTLHREQAAELGANELGRARFTLFEERFVDAYARNRATGRFIVVDPDSNLTLGAGMIVDREVERERAQPGSEVLLTPSPGKVSAAERARLLRQRPATFWLTGLSGAGKSTLATELERRLVSRGGACMLIDGDNLRTGLNRDLGFSPADRQENIRRAAELARLMNDAGLVVIAAFISPYRADRETARRIVGEERFAEVFVNAPLEVCEQRDPKGLYRRARSGATPEFTGVSAPYEPPEHPALMIDTAALSVEQCVELLLAAAQERIAPG